MLFTLGCAASIVRHPWGPASAWSRPAVCSRRFASLGGPKCPYIFNTLGETFGACPGEIRVIVRVFGLTTLHLASSVRPGRPPHILRGCLTGPRRGVS